MSDTKLLVDNFITTYRDKLSNNTIELRKFISKWKMPLGVGLICIIILYLFISKIYNRTYKLTKHLSLYKTNLHIESITNDKEIMSGDFRLCDFYIASSYRSFLVGYQYFDLASIDIIRNVIECGCRYIELDIYPNSFCNDSNPVVVSGKEIGLWQFSNSLDLDIVMRNIREVAFSNKVAVNIREPLFLYLNIYPNESYKLLKKVAEIVDRHFGSRLTNNSSKYRNKFPQTPIRELLDKVVIYSNKKWKGSPMEELINLSPEKYGEEDIVYMRNLNSDMVSDNFDKRELTEFNRRNITRVYPIYNGRESNNYNPSNSWLCGCQIVAINYQTSDQFLDFYLDFFKNCNMRLKPKALRFKPYVFVEAKPQNPAVSFAPVKVSTPLYDIVI